MYMVRKQLYLTHELDSELKRRSEIQGVSEAELVRRALESSFRYGEATPDPLEPGRAKAMTRIEQFWSTSKYRLAADFERGELYTDRLDRYGTPRSDGTG